MSWEITKTRGKRMHELKTEDYTLHITHNAGAPSQASSITATLIEKGKDTHVNLVKRKDEFHIQSIRVTTRTNPEGYFLNPEEQQAHLLKINDVLFENAHTNLDQHAPELFHAIQDAINHHDSNIWQTHQENAMHHAALFTPEHELIIKYRPESILNNKKLYFGLIAKSAPWLEARITHADNPTIVIKDCLTGKGKIKAYTRIIRGREVPASQGDIKKAKMLLKQIFFEHPAKLPKDIIDALVKA